MNKENNIEWKETTCLILLICLVVSSIISINIIIKKSKTIVSLYEEIGQLQRDNDKLSIAIEEAKYKVGDIVIVEFGGVLSDPRYEACEILSIKRQGCSFVYDVSNMSSEGMGINVEEERIIRKAKKSKTEIKTIVHYE
jgi:hypothetical protein